MALIEVHFLTRDETNGRKLCIKHDTINGMAPAEIKSDDIHLIGKTYMKEGTMLWLTAGQKQLVQEDIDTIQKLVSDAIKEENTRYHVQIASAGGGQI